ncbi:MAG: hypothetical protein WCG80_16470 [Spirochaetales bacterium]
MVDFDNLVRDWVLALKKSVEIIDYCPIDVSAWGTEKRFAVWQENVDATFRFDVPLGENLEDNLVLDEAGNKVDRWEGRTFRTEGDKWYLPVNLAIVLATPDDDHVIYEQKGVLGFKILESDAFNEQSKRPQVMDQFIREVLLPELWPVFRQAVFQQFDSWRLPRPDLPWGHPKLSGTVQHSSKV